MTRWPGLIAVAGLVLLSVSSATFLTACTPQRGVMARNDSGARTEIPKAENRLTNSSYDDTPSKGSLALQNVEDPWPLSLLKGKAGRGLGNRTSLAVWSLEDGGGSLTLLESGEAQFSGGDEKGSYSLRLVAAPFTDTTKFSAGAWGANGRYAALLDGRRVSVTEVSAGKVKNTWVDEVPSRGLAAVFTPSGDALLIGGADGRVYKWNYQDATSLLERLTEAEHRSWERYVVHGSSVSALAIHPLGRFFVSGDLRGGLFAILLFDADVFGGEYDENVVPGETFTDKVIRVSAGGAVSGVTQIEMSRNGERFVVGREDGMLELWQVRGFRRLAARAQHRGAMKALAIDERGENVVSYGRDGFVRLLRLRPCQPPAISRGECEFEQVSERKSEEVRAFSFLGNELLTFTASGIRRGPIA